MASRRPTSAQPSPDGHRRSLVSSHQICGLCRYSRSMRSTRRDRLQVIASSGLSGRECKMERDSLSRVLRTGTVCPAGKRRPRMVSRSSGGAKRTGRESGSPGDVQYSRLARSRKMPIRRYTKWTPPPSIENWSQGSAANGRLKRRPSRK
jgi:hypothetical protein